VDVREILRTLCKYKNVEIVAGSVMPDHIHLVVAIPPKLAVSDFVGYLKGKSALQIFDRHPELATRYDRTMWARGYFVSTIADVDEETIKKYVEEQYEESKKEEKGRK
jgi:putative transposase